MASLGNSLLVLKKRSHKAIQIKHIIPIIFVNFVFKGIQNHQIYYTFEWNKVELGKLREAVQNFLQPNPYDYSSRGRISKCSQTYLSLKTWKSNGLQLIEVDCDYIGVSKAMQQGETLQQSQFD